LRREDYPVFFGTAHGLPHCDFHETVVRARRANCGSRGTCEAFAHGVFRASLKHLAEIAESLLDDRSRLAYLTIHQGEHSGRLLGLCVSV